MIEEVEEPMSEEEFERRQAWTFCAGETSMAKAIMNHILSESGKFFTMKKDEEARLLRNLADTIEKKWHAPANTKLDEFIKQDRED